MRAPTPNNPPTPSIISDHQSVLEQVLHTIRSSELESNQLTEISQVFHGDRQISGINWDVEEREILMDLKWTLTDPFWKRPYGWLKVRIRDQIIIWKWGRYCLDKVAIHSWDWHLFSQAVYINLNRCDSTNNSNITIIFPLFTESYQGERVLYPTQGTPDSGMNYSNASSPSAVDGNISNHFPCTPYLDIQLLVALVIKILIDIVGAMASVCLLVVCYIKNERDPNAANLIIGQLVTCWLLLNLMALTPPPPISLYSSTISAIMYLAMWFSLICLLDLPLQPVLKKLI